MTNLIDQLRSANTIGEGRELLVGLKKPELVKLAKDNGIYWRDTTREKIIDRILNSTIQSRLTSKAIEELVLQEIRVY